MKKTVLLLVCFVVCSGVLYGAGGSGGPMGMLYMVDLSKLNDSLAVDGINFKNNDLLVWGGAGTNWLTNSIGIGAMGLAGFQFSEDRSAALYLGTAGLCIQNIITEGSVSQVTLMYGPGFTTLHLVRGVGVNRAEYSVGGMAFFAAITIQLKISDMTRIEFNFGGNMVSNEKWEQLTGPAAYLLPADTDITGIYGAVVLRFGGTYVSEQSGIYLNTPATSTVKY
jgi:hypothetical protein